MISDEHDVSRYIDLRPVESFWNI